MERRPINKKPKKKKLKEDSVYYSRGIKKGKTGAPKNGR